jgi:hypothetical protein
MRKSGRSQRRKAIFEAIDNDRIFPLLPRISVHTEYIEPGDNSPIDVALRNISENDGSNYFGVVQTKDQQVSRSGIQP